MIYKKVFNIELKYFVWNGEPNISRMSLKYLAEQRDNMP